MTQHNGGALVSPGKGDQRQYDLAGDGVQLQITSTHLTWPLDITILSLSYQGPGGSGTFSRNTIRSQTSEIGTLLTVTLQVIQVSGEETKLTVLLPTVQLTGSSESGVNIETLAIVTTQSDMTMGPPPSGQTQSYQVYRLQGTVQLTPTGGAVTLSVDSTTYNLGDPIVVTLSNQSTQSITVLDHLTNCSIIQLQRQEDSTWSDVYPCNREIATLPHTVEPGQSLTVEFDGVPDSTGLYRATESSRTIYSQEFEVLEAPTA